MFLPNLHASGTLARGAGVWWLDVPSRADIAPSQRFLRGLRRAAGWPARRVLDTRVRWTVNEIEERLDSAQQKLHARLDRIETLAEEALRAAPTHPSKLGDEELQAPAPLRLERLHPNLARLVDLASGPDGFAAQAGVWFNPPIALEHRPGEVRVAQVNERILEQPFAFRALASLPQGARVLDVGGSESQVALSLASLGYEVTVVDPRGYPIDHPRLTTVAAPFDQLPSEHRDFDAALALSAVEHFGLGHYGEGTEPGRRLDLEALADTRERVRPGGRLVLTVPLGVPSVDDFQRVYDLDGVRELLAGWQVLELAAAWRRDATGWELGPVEAPATAATGPGVALAIAERPGA